MSDKPEKRHEKPDTYYEFFNERLLSVIPPDAEKFLDVGCASGILGLSIKAKRPGAIVHGIERESRAAASAAERLDSVLEGDLIDLLPDIRETYDCIICADILEHLEDPWQALRRLGELLVPSGHVVASIPNIRYYKVLRELVIHGRFTYRGSGILDSTHLRFFTRREMAVLFERAGLTVTRQMPVIKGKNTVMRLLDAFCFKALSDFRAFQYVTVGRRDVDGGGR